MSPIIVPAPQRALQWAASLQPGSYGFSSSKQTSAGDGQNSRLRLTPVYFHRSVTIDRLGFEVTTVGENGCAFRPGVYADSGNLYPGALLLDAGAVPADAAAGTGIKEITVSLVIPAGVVWFGGANQGAPTTRPALRMVSGSPPVGTDVSTGSSANQASWNQGSVTGALPTTFTATPSGSGGNAVARIFWRIAA